MDRSLTFRFFGRDVSVGKATDSISKKLNSLGPMGKRAGGALDKLGLSGVSMGAAVTAGAGAAATAITAFAADAVRDYIKLAGEIRNFQRVSGASAEEASAFVAVLDDMGVEAEAGSKAIGKLARADLAQLGIEVARNKDGTTNLVETLLNLADAYKATADPAEKQRLVFAALGKSGADLIPILEQGRVGLKRFFEGVEGTEQIFSQKQIDEAREYELAVDDLQDAFGDLQRGAARELVPALSDVALVMATTVRAAGDLKGVIGKLIPDQPKMAQGWRNVARDAGDAADQSEELEEATKAAAEAARENAAAIAAQAEEYDGLVTSIRGSMGVFEELPEKAALSQQELIKRLTENRNYQRDLALAMEDLAAAGISEPVRAELFDLEKSAPGTVARVVKQGITVPFATALNAGLADLDFTSRVLADIETTGRRSAATATAAGRMAGAAFAGGYKDAVSASLAGYSAAPGSSGDRNTTRTATSGRTPVTVNVTSTASRISAAEARRLGMEVGGRS